MFRHTWFLILSLACLMGCGEGVKYSSKVRGTVTLDGKPLTTGKVVSMPLQGGRGGEGEIQQDGTFVLVTDEQGENVVPGQHRLAVVAFKPRQHDESFNPEAELQFLVPLRYTDPGQSGFVVDVAAGEEKVVDLAMTSGK